MRQPLSVRYVGLGAYSTQFNDVFSSISNQASLAQLKGSSAGVYGERKFLLSELNQYSAIIGLPTKSGTYAIQGDYFGSSEFNETQIGIAYGRKVTSKVDIGVKFNFHNVRIPVYGSASAINFEAGTIFHLTDNLHAGVSVYNPFSSTLGKNSNEKLAAIYRFGLGYEVSDKVFLSAEIVKHEDRPVGVNAGAQYNIMEKVFLRAGIATATNNNFAGVGFQLGQFRIDVNTGYHQQLGFTPGMMLLYQFKKKTAGE